MATSESNEDYDPSKDPNRKPKNIKDPVWKYGYFVDPITKTLIKCTLCGKEISSGAGRMKKHLAGGYTEVTMCPKTTTLIIKEMKDQLVKGSKKKKAVTLDDEIESGDGDGDDSVEVSVDETSTCASSKAPTKPSSSKRQKTLSFKLPQLKSTKTVASMLRKTPEEVVEERHRKGPRQTTLDNCSRSEEEKKRVEMHVANFFYENGIPFNAAHSRSFEIMVESIGQLGPGWKPPSYHKLRIPLLEESKKEIDKIKEEHQKSWKLYGCTLMCDGWTDKRTRHLINFLVNSQEGTFFLSSVDVSSKVQDASMLADLIEEQINLIGREYVVQVVTDNGANFKAAGRQLCLRIPTLYWTPCAAHYLDLMLEDIAKLKGFSVCITHAKNITTFICRHGRLLHSMREKTGGKDIVRPGATRFATAFLTLQSLYKHKDALRKLFGGEDWFASKLANTTAGSKVHDAVLSLRFWNNVEDCIRASQPLLVVLRVVDGDEKPAMPEVYALMDLAKRKIKDALESKQRLLNKVLGIIEKRWETQMNVDLYGAALFLNPKQFFDIKETDFAWASQLRIKFNVILEKIIIDTNLREKISGQVDQYENTRGDFARQMTIQGRKSKNPIDWWGALGGYTFELMKFAKRIVGLCCSSSGCERNWSTFEFIHTKKRNRLEHKRLNDLVYVQYNRKIASRFQIRHEQGTNFSPLILEDFQWEHEWVSGDVVDVGVDEETWAAVDVALDASEGIRNRRCNRHERLVSGSSSQLEDSFDMEMEEAPNPPILNDDFDSDDDHMPIASTHEDDDGEANALVELDDSI